MSKHTEGKWEVNEDSPYKIVVVSPWSDKVKPGNTPTFADYRGAHICYIEFNTGVPTKAQAEANARLIAAAPELLEALKEALKDYDPAESWGSVIDKGLRAIAKAEGE